LIELPNQGHVIVPHVTLLSKSSNVNFTQSHGNSRPTSFRELIGSTSGGKWTAYSKHRAACAAPLQSPGRLRGTAFIWRCAA